MTFLLNTLISKPLSLILSHSELADRGQKLTMIRLFSNSQFSLSILINKP